MPNRQIENNFETVEQWVVKYNGLVTDVGDIDLLQFAASSVVAASNNLDTRVVDLDTRLGPDSPLATLTSAGLLTTDTNVSIESAWVAYRDYVGHDTVLNTVATTVAGAVNEVEDRVGLISDLNIVAVDAVDGINIVNSKIDSTDTRLGLQTELNVLDPTLPADSTNEAIGSVWTAYDTYVGHDVALTTTAQTVSGSLNELDFELGSLGALRTQVSDTNLVAALNKLDVLVGDLTALDAGFTGTSDDSLVNAINFIYSIQTGDTVAFANITASGTLGVAGVSTLEGDVTAESALTVLGAFTSRGIDDNATVNVVTITNSNTAFTTNISTTGDVIADSGGIRVNGAVGMYTGGGAERIHFDSDSIRITTNNSLVADFSSVTGVVFNANLDVSGTASFNTSITVDGNEVFHAGNDGPGSNMNADLLDGLQASAFAKLSGNQVFANDVTIDGNLTVGGTVNYKTTEVIQIEDEFIALNSGTTVDTNGGVTVTRPVGGDTSIQWTEAADRWEIWTSGTRDGAILLDTDNVDASTLDGQSGSYYRAWANLTGVPSTFPPSSHSHTAADIVSGVFTTALIPNLAATKITSGTFATARIPSLPASQITSGTFNAARIPSLDATTITTGIFDANRIPSLDASKITTGILGDARIPNISGAKITSGTVAAARIASLPASQITSGTFATTRIPPITTGMIDATTLILNTEAWSYSNSRLATAASIQDYVNGRGFITAAGGTNFGADISVNGNTIFHAGNDGPGSNMNADLLDGLQASSFLRSDANDIKTSGYLRLNDSLLLQMGSGADGELVHNGSHQYFDINTGNLYIRDGSTTRYTFDTASGNFTATGNVTAFSDRSLKKDLRVINSPLAKVEMINGYYYKWNDVAEDLGIVKEDRWEVGLIAQEVDTVLPEVVFGDEVKHVAYSKMVPLLVEAIKELSEKVRKLEGA